MNIICFGTAFGPQLATFSKQSPGELNRQPLFLKAVGGLGHRRLSEKKGCLILFLFFRVNQHFPSEPSAKVTRTKRNTMLGLELGAMKRLKTVWGDARRPDTLQIVFQSVQEMFLLLCTLTSPNHTFEALPRLSAHSLSFVSRQLKIVTQQHEVSQTWKMPHAPQLKSNCWFQSQCAISPFNTICESTQELLRFQSLSAPKLNTTDIDRRFLHHEVLSIVSIPHVHPKFPCAHCANFIGSVGEARLRMIQIPQYP